ncbi:nuclear transcription factor Y subunit B-1-like isoform X1 [Lotus japonicus]|uniref:nuclear transcription factor Y subunit B-1-like isoform X1 n=1 Tax=Lotus japonicus TaxID=34305 RepID=UPI00258DAF6F|nr:nuclear transcription factor Y subunit B-1-like isoform X1 [Lotus japonicus]
MADAPASPPDESGDHSPRSSFREQDRFLPVANISRIMKKGLPANGKIAKDAKETVQECVSEFISFVTSEASDKCQREKRKTINGDDLLWAMATLGFEEYIDPLKLYLAAYREVILNLQFFLISMDCCSYIVEYSASGIWYLWYSVLIWFAAVNFQFSLMVFFCCFFFSCVDFSWVDSNVAD